MLERKLLKVEKLVKKYKGKRVVDELSLQVYQGEIVGLLGPNGAGKTTTFYIIAGLIKPDSGKIFLDDLDITNFPVYKRANLGISYLPQEPSVFRKLTVEENIATVLEYKGYSPQEIKEITDRMIEYFGLEKVRKQKAITLSGGERRRVEVARLLATNPRFLLLDEPFTGIDPKTISDIQKIIKKLREEFGIGIIITDHNVREALKIVDRAYLIHFGKIIEEGTPEEIMNSDIAKTVYLGEDFYT